MAEYWILMICMGFIICEPTITYKHATLDSCVRQEMEVNAAKPRRNTTCFRVTKKQIATPLKQLPAPSGVIIKPYNLEEALKK